MWSSNYSDRSISSVWITAKLGDRLVPARCHHNEVTAEAIETLATFAVDSGAKPILLSATMKTALILVVGKRVGKAV
jgi:hypothetical protein